MACSFPLQRLHGRRLDEEGGKHAVGDIWIFALSCEIAPQVEII